MKLTLQKALYNAAMLAAPALVVPPFLFFKRGREQLFDRFGFWNLSLDKSIWLHGASLGEMVGLSHIARELKSVVPQFPIIASATSPTALPKAKEFAVAQKLLPFDHPLYFKRCLKSISPMAFIFGETELWPNLLAYIGQQKIPAYLVNGRISDRTFGRYLKFQPIVQECFKQINHIFAASELAQERFIALGANIEKISVIPNTKYDIPIKSLGAIEQKLALKKSLFKNNLPLVVLSSIRPAEELVLFKAIQSLEEQSILLNYIVAPRHAEKFSYFETKMREFGFNFRSRTESKEACEQRFIFLDTVGELASLIPAAELAFVGGTFADYGGHNPLEPAACGVAPVVGPFSATVRDIVEVLNGKSALLEASSYQEVTRILMKVAKQSEEIKLVADRARQVALEYTGGSRTVVARVIGDLGG